MNNSKLLPWGANLIRAVFLGGFSMSAWGAGQADVMTVPPHPVTQQDVFITAYGTWTDGCVPRDGQASVAGNEIHIDFPPFGAGMLCPQMLADWAETIRVPAQLPTGTYEVIVTYGQEPEPPYEIGRGTFKVRDRDHSLRSVDPRKLVCTNQRTGKTVVIKKSIEAGSGKIPSELGDLLVCQENGLKVRPRDTIVQKLIGIVR
jgi:hypothetical protein